MSKLDGLRAMREAKYEASRAAKPAATGRPKVAATSAPAKAPATPAGPASSDLCGHKSMNGRTCTRERGHTAKSHRYS